MRRVKMYNILLGIIAVTGLLMFYIWMPVGHDTPFHMSRIVNEVYMMREHGLWKMPYYLYETAREGYGYGAPLFYCDHFIYPFAAFVLLGVSKVTAYKLMMISVLLFAFSNAYFSIYQWKRKRDLAMLGAVIYMFHPYFVSDMVERAAVGEAFALAFVPLACCGLYLIFAEKFRRGTICLVIGMCGVICSHVITTLLLALYFMVIVFAMVKRWDWNKVKWLSIAFLVCCCLTMWYWLPMLEQLCTMQFSTPVGGENYVQKRCMVDNLFIPYGLHEILSYKLNILPKNITYVPGGMIWFPLIIAGYMLCYKQYRNNKVIKWCFGSCVVFVILASSKVVCSVLQNVIGMIQFPWRWYILLTPVSVIAFVELADKGKKFTRYLLFIATILLTVSSVVTIMTRTILKSYPSEEAYKYLDYFEENDGALDSLYFPRTYSAEYCEMKKQEIDCNKDIQYAIVRSRDGFIVTLNTDQTDMELEFPLTMYRGYYADNLDSGDVYRVEESEHGLVNVIVNNYQGGDIRVYYRGTVLQRISKYVSGIAFGVVIIGIILRLVRKGAICIILKDNAGKREAEHL